jgi:hypothetical protein
MVGIAAAATALAVVLTLSVGWFGVSTVRAQENSSDSAATEAELELARRFAPVIVVREQPEPCDTNGEPFEPAPVEIVLDNPEVSLRVGGNGDPVSRFGPSATDLFDLREGWYLDFPGDALAPGCTFETDFRRFWDGRSVVSAHVATQADRPGLLALQSVH